jgi:hypothetical protein
VNLREQIFSEPELREAPPVLVDVGAAGGVPRVWRRIARYAVGAGFEPDAREVAPLNTAQRRFRRWVFCSGLAVPAETADGCQPLHLTRAPQCSSTLRPRAAALGEWAFANFFDVEETRSLPAATLAGALINTSGLVRASSIVDRGGEIHILGEQVTTAGRIGVNLDGWLIRAVL